MDKEEIKQKLEQAKRDKQLSDLTYAKEIENLKHELAEAEKLKIWDYGISGTSHFPRIVLPDGKLSTKTAIISGDREADRPTIIYGNLADDLKAISEPLEEFELDIHKYYIDKRPEMSHAPIYIAGNWHTLDELSAYILNLRRLEATAIRKGKE